MERPYEALSRVYDAGWGDFSIQYVPLITDRLAERAIHPARILDLACGTGILAHALARYGHTVRGIDISPEMIRLAEQRVTGPVDLSFRVDDMLEYEPEGKYDVIACTFDSINYVRKLADIRKLFKTVAGALRERGLFLFDTNTVSMYTRHNEPDERRVINGEVFIHQCRYNARQNLAITTFSFQDGAFEVHYQRPYSFDELAPYLDKAGLRVIERFSWFSRLPYAEGSPKVFVITEKEGKE